MEDLHLGATKLKHLEVDDIGIYADDRVENQGLHYPTEHLKALILSRIYEVEIEAEDREEEG